MWTTLAVFLIKISKFRKSPLLAIMHIPKSWLHANFRALLLAHSKATAFQSYVVIFGWTNFYVLKISGKNPLCPDLTHF